jgi:hypothetical protein
LAALVYLLYSGHPVLLEEFIPAIEMPYGTIIAWLALILFPLLAYLFIAQTAPMLSEIFQLVVGRLVRIALFMGVFWGVICYYLAENWHYSFSRSLAHQDARSQAFWLLTSSIPILTIVALLAVAIGLGIYALKQQKN